MPPRFLPSFIDLESASLALGLPPNTKLQKDSMAGIATGDAAASTVLRLTLKPKVFQVDFTPSLVIELPPPLINIGLGGIEYNLASGAITPRLWYESRIGIPVGESAALEGACSFMRNLVTSTPMAIPPYDPTHDPELILTAQQILTNLDGGGGGSLVRDVSFSAYLILLEDIGADVGDGGFRIPAGAKLSIQVDLVGTPAEVRASPKILRVEVESTSLVLRSGGADQAELGRLVLLPGGAVEVKQVRPLGSVEKAAAIESLARLLGHLGTPESSFGIDPAKLQPQGVEEILKKEIEKALRQAVVRWAKENAKRVAGLDLRSVLGIEA